MPLPYAVVLHAEVALVEEKEDLLHLQIQDQHGDMNIYPIRAGLVKKIDTVLRAIILPQPLAVRHNWTHISIEEYEDYLDQTAAKDQRMKERKTRIEKNTEGTVDKETEELLEGLYDDEE